MDSIQVYFDMVSLQGKQESLALTKIVLPNKEIRSGHGPDGTGLNIHKSLSAGTPRASILSLN